MCDKTYDNFKDYIEKRTVEDIMNDYSEQKDEWKISQTVETNDNTSSDCSIKSN